MKYIVEVTTSNPSHEHISLRRVQKKTSFVVEANNENEALMRARGKFRSLGHYVHNVQLIEKKEKEAPYEYKTSTWGPGTGGKIKTYKPGEWDPKTNRYWGGTEIGDESYEDRFDNTPDRIIDKKTGELIWDRKETGDNWRYETRDELERRYRSERQYDGTLRTAGFNAPGTNKPFSGPGSDNHAGEDAKTQDFETWRKNWEKYGRTKVAFGKDAPSFVGEPVHPDESKWNNRDSNSGPSNSGPSNSGPSNSGPSEAERLRYGNVGAQIRHIDPEAYKNRPGTYQGNIDLLAKLKANNMRNEEVGQVDVQLMEKEARYEYLVKDPETDDPETDDPASDIRKQGVTGARIKALSSNQFSTRKDRLDQSKVDSILGANKYKAGSTESNLALLKYFKDKAASVAGQQDNQTTFTPAAAPPAAAPPAAAPPAAAPPAAAPPAAAPEKKPGFFKRLGNAIRNNDDGYTVFGKESQKEKDRMGNNKLSVGGVGADAAKNAFFANNDSAPTTGPKVKYEIGKSEVSSDEFEREKRRGNLATDYRFTLKNKDGTQRVVGSKDPDYKDLVGKYVKEENSVEYIEEKLTAADPASKWISDFVASDNPKFKGKSKKERIRMALGAKYAAMRNEEVEQVDEKISLGAPVSDQLKAKEKVAKSMEDKPDTAVAKIDKSIENTKDKDPEYSKRVSAFKDEYLKKKKAADAGETTLVAKEEVEQIDEAFDQSSPSHAKVKELVSNYGNRSAMRAVYHGDGSATIHTTGDKKVSSATRVDHIHDQAGLGYNRPAAEYKNLSKSKGGLKFKTKETEGKSIYGSHEIHISHKGMKEEVEQIDEADTSDANYDMINRDALPVPPHRNIRGVQDRINADKRKERDAAAQEKEKAKDKISIALDRVKAKSKLNKINTKPEMDADVKGK